jgi:hypothetical protein
MKNLRSSIRVMEAENHVKNRAIGAETISKHGASSKSKTSRENNKILCPMTKSFCGVSIACIVILFCVGLKTAQAQNYPQKVLADFDAHCKKEWTKRGVLDKRMYDYCVKQEKEGYDKMKYLEEKYKKYSWLQDLKSSIITEWTNAGVTRWRMVGYTLEKEIDAYLDIQYGLTHSEFSKSKYESCYSKWKKSRPDCYWSMTLHCLKND